MYSDVMQGGKWQLPKEGRCRYVGLRIAKYYDKHSSIRGFCGRASCICFRQKNNPPCSWPFGVMGYFFPRKPLLFLQVAIHVENQSLAGPHIYNVTYTIWMYWLNIN